MAVNYFCAADKETQESLALLDACEAILCSAEASIPFSWLSKPDSIESVPILDRVVIEERWKLLRTTCSLWISLYHAHHLGLRFDHGTDQVVIESRFEGPSPIQRLFPRKSELKTEQKTDVIHYMAFFACELGPGPPSTGGPIDKAVMYSTLRLIQYGWDVTWTLVRISLAQSVSRALVSLSEEKCVKLVNRTNDVKFFNSVSVRDMDIGTNVARTWALVEYAARITNDMAEFRGVLDLWATMFEHAFAVYSLVDIISRDNSTPKDAINSVVRLYSIATKCTPQLCELAKYLSTTMAKSAPVPTVYAIEEMSAWLNFAASANAWLIQHHANESIPCAGCPSSASFSKAASSLDGYVRKNMDMGCWAVETTPKEQVNRECWAGRAISAINGLISCGNVPADKLVGVSVVPAAFEKRVADDDPRRYVRVCVRAYSNGPLKKDQFVHLNLVSDQS